MTMITSLSAMLRANILDDDINSVGNKEETTKRKARFLSLLDKAVLRFSTELEKGHIEMTNVADLEKLVKLTLLVSGEAESIIESQEKNKAKVSLISVDDEEIIRTLLKSDNPELTGLFENILMQYNKKNDEEELS